MPKNQKNMTKITIDKEKNIRYNRSIKQNKGKIKNGKNKRF